jgi:hypothetical protein
LPALVCEPVERNSGGNLICNLHEGFNHTLRFARTSNSRNRIRKRCERHWVCLKNTKWFGFVGGCPAKLLELLKNFEMSMKILFILLIMSTNAVAMDRWTALAMLESGDDDRAVGRVGEISRYQIRPELWRGGNPLDGNVALANAQRIMSARVAAFEKSHGRAPDDFEFYVLWNAPAEINHPHRAVAARARRFVNLMAFGGPKTEAPYETALDAPQRTYFK